jgi:fatty acid desaturase
MTVRNMPASDLPMSDLPMGDAAASDDTASGVARSAPPWLRHCISLARPFAFSQQARWRHNLRNSTALASLLGAGAGLAAASRVLPAPLYVPLAAFGFGWLFFGLLVLVVHEASHGMFLSHPKPAKRRALNHWFGTLCCVPFAIHYAHHWERGHSLHHRDPMTPSDPQRFSALTGRAFWRLFLGLLFVPGLAYVERLLSRQNRERGVSGGRTLPLFVAFWLLGGSALGVAGAWPVLWALLWGLQVLSALNQLKGALEHGGRIALDPNPFLRSRSTLSPWLERLMPFDINLHFEHHLNPTVPWYRLREYQHAILPHIPPSQRDRLLNPRALAQLHGLVD